MLPKEEIRKITGQDSADRVPSYKLNEVSMNGDEGTFRLRELLAEKNADGRYNVEQLGDMLSGVILKMRWRMSRYEEDQPSLSTTEYDNKYQDEIIVFPSKENGTPADLKVKYKLSTERVVYLYLSEKRQIVRLRVRASALSGEKNPNGEKGLFDYVDEHKEADTGLHEYITTCKGVFREGKNSDGSHNKRKDHYAMTFECGRKLTESEQEKVDAMILEVHNNTKKPAPPPSPAPSDDYPEGEVTPDDIPF